MIAFPQVLSTLVLILILANRSYRKILGWVILVLVVVNVVGFLIQNGAVAL